MHKTGGKCPDIIFNSTSHDSSPEESQATFPVPLQATPHGQPHGMADASTNASFSEAFFELFILLVVNVLPLLSWSKSLDECSNHQN